MKQNIANHKEEKKIQFHAELDFGKAVFNSRCRRNGRMKKKVTAKIFTIYDVQTHLCTLPTNARTHTHLQRIRES